MLFSRKVDDLLLPAKLRCLRWLWLVQAATGIDMLVVATLRDAEAQNLLYSQGRTRAQLDSAGLLAVQPQPGPIVTNASGGRSIHQYALAWDAVPLRAGKPVWSDAAKSDRALWLAVGGIAEACGIAWSGRWKGRLRELGHFQFTGGLTLGDLAQGKRPSDGGALKLPDVEELPESLRQRFA